MPIQVCLVILKDLSDFQMVLVILLVFPAIFGLSALVKWIGRKISAKSKKDSIIRLSGQFKQNGHKNQVLEHIIDNQELINNK